MKKLRRGLLVCVALLALASAGFAQAQFAIGVKGGLNFAKLDVSSAEGTYNSRTGYHLGAFALIKLTKIGIQPEIIFSQQGSEVKDPNLGNFESNFSYVNIPVIVKLYTVAGINIQAGPQFGFLTSAEFDDQDIKDELKGSDISLALGLGWDLPFGLTVDGRYNLGLSDVSDSDAMGEIKNQVWQISVGFKLIKLGK